MKHIINTVILITSLLISLSIGKGFGQTSSDTTSIRKTCLNYIEGFYTNDYHRIEKAVHPELAKRVIRKDKDGFVMIHNMGVSELLFNAKNFTKPEDNTNVPFKADIVIYDISCDIATVKITQNKMNLIDYLHLGKINGEWKIINVMWAWKE